MGASLDVILVSIWLKQFEENIVAEETRLGPPKMNKNLPFPCGMCEKNVSFAMTKRWFNKGRADLLLEILKYRTRRIGLAGVSS